MNVSTRKLTELFVRYGTKNGEKKDSPPALYNETSIILFGSMFAGGKTRPWNTSLRYLGAVLCEICKFYVNHQNARHQNGSCKFAENRQSLQTTTESVSSAVVAILAKFGTTTWVCSVVVSPREHKTHGMSWPQEETLAVLQMLPRLSLKSFD